MRDPFSTAMFCWSEMARYWFSGPGDGCCEPECGRCRPRRAYACDCPKCRPDSHDRYPHDHDHYDPQGPVARGCDITVEIVVIGPRGTKVSVRPFGEMPEGDLEVAFTQMAAQPPIKAEVSYRHGVLGVRVEVSDQHKTSAAYSGHIITSGKRHHLGELYVEVPAAATA